MSISQEVDIFRFLEENQRASFDPFLWMSGCLVSTHYSSILFLSILFTFHSLYHIFSQCVCVLGGGRVGTGQQSRNSHWWEWQCGVLERQSSDPLSHCWPGLCVGQGFPSHKKRNQKKEGPRPKQKDRSEMEPRNLNVSDMHRGFWFR